MAQAKKKVFKAKNTYLKPEKVEKKASGVKNGDLKTKITQAAEIS